MKGSTVHIQESDMIITGAQVDPPPGGRCKQHTRVVSTHPGRHWKVVAWAGSWALELHARASEGAGQVLTPVPQREAPVDREGVSVTL